MNSIPVEVSGDVWYNPEQVKQALYQIPQGQKAVLDFRAEGPSLEALGIKAVLDQWLRDRNYQSNMVEITCWSNAAESIQYKKSLCSVPSHFWGMSRDYWIDPVTQGPGIGIFGLFIGRTTIARSVILYECYKQYSPGFVFSKMFNEQLDPWDTRFKFVNLENFADWSDSAQAIIDWFKHCPVSSLDQKTVRDQFGNVDNHALCNRSLLQHYHKFDIELVCETYTAGTTFFPTEKTARPIMAQKPILVYGPVNFLDRLKKMGFKTYDSVWDESYDQLHGAQRWQAIKKIIHNFLSLTPHQRDIVLQHCQYIAEYNRQHLANMINL